MKFSRIACVDNVNLTAEAYTALSALSTAPFTPCNADPVSQAEILQRMEAADCALVSWRTPLDGTVISGLSLLRYIGLCASKYANPGAGNIDLAAARKRNITVTAVGQYGDEATAEFIFCCLLNLCRGLQGTKWLKMPCELYGKRLGIIGMGAMGFHVLRLAVGFGMDVVYFSRRRKLECEALGAKYVDKTELLQSSDIVSLHVPKGTLVMSEAEFAQMNEQAILVNTCLGAVFAKEDLQNWLKVPTHFVIMDESADAVYRTLRGLPNVVFPEIVAGSTIESRRRLSTQVLLNLKSYLKGRAQNVIT